MMSTGTARAAVASARAATRLRNCMASEVVGGGEAVARGEGSSVEMWNSRANWRKGMAFHLELFMPQPAYLLVEGKARHVELVITLGYINPQ